MADNRAGGIAPWPSTTNRRVLLRSRTRGRAASRADFEVADAPLPAAADGEILLSHPLALARSLHARAHERPASPTRRPSSSASRWSAAPSARSCESKHPGVSPQATSCRLRRAGSPITSRGRRGAGPFGPLKLDPKAAPISTALGVLGMPGMTAYVGLLDHRPAEGRRDGRRLGGGGRGRLGGRPARQDQGLPRGRRRRLAGQVRLRREGAGLRRLRRLPRARISSPRSRTPAPRASTSTSTTSAAPCSRPCCG